MNSEFLDAFRSASDALAVEINKIDADIEANDVGDEDDITSQILGRIKAKAESLRGPIAWDATQISLDGRVRLGGRRLTSRGQGAEEKVLGADVVLVFDADLPGYKTSKGLLIQAKRVGSTGELISESERRRLLEQCRKMSVISSSSFVWAYGKETRVFSANSVLAADGELGNVQGTWPMSVFFFDFFVCWIGDARINSVSRDTLKPFMELTGIDHGLIVSGRLNERFIRDRMF